LSDLLTRKYSLHGLALQLGCAVPALVPRVHHLLGQFIVHDFPEDFTPAQGSIEPFSQEQVLRHLSADAVRLASTDGLVEIYQDGERFWRVDERVGMIEMNFLKRQWRAWILPHAVLDLARTAEMTLLWPLSQLLRSRGLYLLPAVSVVRAGWGVLILAPFSMEPELRGLIRAGYRIIGQQWTAIRQDAGRLELLYVPGQVQRVGAPDTTTSTAASIEPWVDLVAEHRGCWQRHAFLDVVLMISRGRRPKGHLLELTEDHAAEALRSNWPLLDVHPHRRGSALPAMLARHARCCALQLSRSAADLLVLLDSLKFSPAGAAPAGARVASPEPLSA